MPANGLQPGEVANFGSEISRLERTSYEKSSSRKTNHSNLAWVRLTAGETSRKIFSFQFYSASKNKKFCAFPTAAERKKRNVANSRHAKLRLATTKIGKLDFKTGNIQWWKFREQISIRFLRKENREQIFAKFKLTFLRFGIACR